MAKLLPTAPRLSLFSSTPCLQNGAVTPIRATSIRQSPQIHCHQYYTRPSRLTLQCSRSRSNFPSSTHSHNVAPQRFLRRNYYTATSPPSNPYGPAETAILSAALDHVPAHGFSVQSLSLGATHAGYLPASINLFSRGPFDLVLYYLVTQRLALNHLVQFPTPLSANNHSDAKPLSTGAKVRALLLARLRANESIIHQYSEALALMSFAGNIPASTAELARLVDEIWYLAGDVSVDTSWYTKRGLLAGIYASAEVFMTQDRSQAFKETENFVDRRLDEVRRLGGATGAVGEWVGYTASSVVNVARSLGVRI